jgi:tetratricopeptide (TPR) repeat protein
MAYCAAASSTTTLLFAATASWFTRRGGGCGASWVVSALATRRMATSLALSLKAHKIPPFRSSAVVRSSFSSSSIPLPQQPPPSIVQERVSRWNTLQTLLQRHGAPGSVHCSTPLDLVPIDKSTSPNVDWANLHPYLYPICQSAATGHLLCAYRNVDIELSSTQNPRQHDAWSIVETKVGGPGMHLVALSSEHLMRRIICQVDYNQEDTVDDSIELYNQDLGQGQLAPSLAAGALDTPYVAGSVAQLKLGVEKYLLLRVGPFADLYQQLARAHYAKQDVASALIAAESANAKLPGFASHFLFYARLLNQMPQRHEESRDAARQCLRLPSVPTIGLSWRDFHDVAVLGQLLTADELDAGDSDDTPPQQALAKLHHLYRLYKSVEQTNAKQASDETPEHLVSDQANDLINETVLTGQPWSSIRSKLAALFQSIGKDDLATFVNH